MALRRRRRRRRTRCPENPLLQFCSVECAKRSGMSHRVGVQPFQRRAETALPPRRSVSGALDRGRALKAAGQVRDLPGGTGVRAR